MQKVFSLDLETLSDLLGPSDRNLKLIRKDYPNVRIYLKEEALVLEGEEEDVEEVGEVLNELIRIHRRFGRVEEWDILETINKVKKRLGKLNYIEIVTPKRRVIPHTDRQNEYLLSIERNDITFGIGPAGTGKTFLAVAMGVKYLKEEKVERIILTRPAVEAGESLGYLPGTFEEKISPYLTPLYDALFSLLPGDKVNRLIESRIVEIAPLAYMRGRTLSEAFIILDEAQNTTISQMKMFLTRLGLRSKVVITGDITQIDLPKRKASGLVHAIKILRDIEGIGFVFFDKEDVVRHPLVKKIIEAYEKQEQLD